MKSHATMPLILSSYKLNSFLAMANVETVAARAELLEKDNFVLCLCVNRFARKLTRTACYAALC